MSVKKSILRFLNDNFATIRDEELILDVDFSGPLELIPETRVLISALVLDNTETLVSEGVDYTLDKTAGTITILGTGSLLSGDSFIAQIRTIPQGKFTNKTKALEFQEENLEDHRPAIFVQAWPRRYPMPFNQTKFQPREQEDGSYILERTRRHMARVQLDLFGRDRDEVDLMWIALNELIGEVTFIPFLDFKSVPKEIGKISLFYDPSLAPEWDKPRITIDYKARIEISETRAQLTFGEEPEIEAEIDGEPVDLDPPPPIVIPAKLTFDADFLYGTTGDAVLEDPDYKVFFG